MMRIRIPFHGVILVLLVALFPLISPVPFLIPDSQILDTDEHAPIFSLSEGNSEANLTWTSRTQLIPQLLENESIAFGDHVVLNATFPQTQNVTECRLNIWNIQANVNTTVSCVGSSIILDTYYLDRSNQTYSIMVNGTTNTNDSIIITWENVSICNFFAPVPHAFHPTEYEDLVYNISWNCVDLNQDDVNYYSVWLSRDNGVTYVLLEQNLTQTWFCWNSSTWLKANYIAMIRAYSVDYSSSECRMDNPPLSYWPGDYSDIITDTFGGGIHFGPPPIYYILDVELFANTSYYFGSTENSITVHLIFDYYIPTSVRYFVYDNGTSWFNGEYSPQSYSENFTINIDGLPIGSHNISIVITESTTSCNRIVTINVIEPDSTHGNPLNWPLIQAIAVGVSIGSVAIIAVVIILSIRLRRNRVVEYMID